MRESTKRFTFFFFLIFGFYLHSNINKTFFFSLYTHTYTLVVDASIHILEQVPGGYTLAATHTHTHWWWTQAYRYWSSFLVVTHTGGYTHTYTLVVDASIQVLEQLPGGYTHWRLHTGGYTHTYTLVVDASIQVLEQLPGGYTLVVTHIHTGGGRKHTGIGAASTFLFVFFLKLLTPMCVFNK